MKLTPKQNKFVKAYIENGGNGTQAALTAGYSETSAGAIADENMKKPGIKLALDKHKELIANKHDITVASLIEKYREVYELSLEEKQFSASNTALNGIAKITGLDKQVIEHQGKIEHTMIEVEFIAENQIKDISE
ncbi:MAG: hypothetical protein CMI54_01715 [Parcubacteria group bacterium]|nr:hypothetical protein [Parcubacteria group bacterium]|tara:strand:- start:16928 stop:17332 length:405 start_codon:yes stop_codon:yes gene_type:complete